MAQGVNAIARVRRASIEEYVGSGGDGILVTCRKSDIINKYIKENRSQVFFHHRIELEIKEERKLGCKLWR